MSKITTESEASGGAAVIEVKFIDSLNEPVEPETLLEESEAEEVAQ